MEDVDPSNLFDLVEAPAVPAAPVHATACSSTEPGARGRNPQEKTEEAGEQEEKKKVGSADGLDKRVLAGIGAFGAVFLAGLAFIVWDQFIRPPSIVGTWRGSLTDYEIGHMITHTQYDLLLDDQKHTSMTLQGKYTSVGTYSVKGNRLKLSLKSEKEPGETRGEDEGEELPTETEYKISLGRATLDLIDPETGKLAVQLIRFREPPVIGQKSEKPAKQVLSANLAADLEKIDKDEDDRLASVEFSPKDGAFKVRHPQGWKTDTGSRPDNLYSWASFTEDSAKIQVLADVKGSLLSGSDSAGQHEEGSESAPVHRRSRALREDCQRRFFRFQREQAPGPQGLGAG